MWCPPRGADARTEKNQAAGKYADCRIPNVNELQSLVNYGASYPSVHGAFNSSCTAGCTVDGVGGPVCSCTASGNYWSSTTYQNTPGNAWHVYFGNGEADANNKSTSPYVRAVRGYARARHVYGATGLSPAIHRRVRDLGSAGASPSKSDFFAPSALRCNCKSALPEDLRRLQRHHRGRVSGDDAGRVIVRRAVRRHVAGIEKRVGGPR